MENVGPVPVVNINTIFVFHFYLHVVLFKLYVFPYEFTNNYHLTNSNKLLEFGYRIGVR